MDIDTAAIFLASSILMALGFIVIVIAVVVINNIIHKFWKSFGWTFFPAYITNGKEMTYEEPKMEKK